MTIYNLTNPFLSRIKSRKLLNKGSAKKTYLVVLDIKKSNITYEPGDSIALIPENDAEIVNLTIQHMHANPNEEIIDPITKKKIKLFDFLLKKANINKATPKFINLFTKASSAQIQNLILSHHIWDILSQFPNHNISAQDICNNMLSLQPRLYSAASSINMHPHEIYLLITHVSYELSKIKRNGVATEYICHKAERIKTPIPIYIQKAHFFHLTKDNNQPIIMIGAGCGIAPYKAFLEERYLNNAKGDNWLFFGERYSDKDFYFKDFFQDLVDKNFLRLTTAFSRDQKDKIYVQDRVLENGPDIWQWLHSNAIIYICGNVKMAKDVEKTLLKIFVEEGNLSIENAGNFLKKITKEKRYLKDVY